MGFILFQNGKLRSPVILGYFLDDSGNFENFVKIWTRIPPNYYQNASKNTRKIMESSWKNIIYVNLGHLKNRKILNSGPTKHLFLLKKIGPPAPQKDKFVQAFSKMFSVVDSWYFRTIIFLKLLKHK